MKKITFYKHVKIDGKEQYKKDTGYLINKNDFEGLENFNLVLHRTQSGKYWNITDLSTGLLVPITPLNRRNDYIDEITRERTVNNKTTTIIELMKDIFEQENIVNAKINLREYAFNNDKDFYNLLMSFDKNTPTTAKNDDVAKENTKNDITNDTPNNTPKKAKKRYHKNDYINNLYFQPCYSQFINATIKALENNAPFQAVKDTFYNIYDDVKNLHKYPNGTVYVSETKETADEIFTIIETINNLSDISVEMIGRFLWTNGKQKQHHKILKSLGFSYQENKAKYCKSYQGYIRKDGRKFSYAKIKQMYAVDEQ